MKEKLTTECRDYYGFPIHVKTPVQPLNDDDFSKTRYVLEIFEKDNDVRMLIGKRYEKTGEEVNPKDYYVIDYSISSVDERIRRWAELDMKKSVHKYIGYKDIDGIELAEGMLLTNAWYEPKTTYYYIAKDLNGKYYLQDNDNPLNSKRIEEVKEFYEVVAKYSGEIIFINKK